ncbi:hypothetical protein FBY30_2753 [Arthrobacter sp. SLBN-83]|uniref:hypothetical protein n=1 Tax=Arthrobacter sp. SLBN-83 TaxID=2768449 RepID=UPI00115269FA|nr:hypothetical protein [Arthrobacter sp. SLBN-83]TQJ60485.1 hypothetical protein FBY30_2753 [Arthrobacter sp. SLBN-83]
MKITSPDKTYTGTSVYGSTTLAFKEGVAETDDLPAGVRLYLQGAGYGIDGAATAPDVPEVLDPRDVSGTEQLGTALRDAAVDPQEGDFLAPTNAGKANPHGPEVIAPEIHASEGVRPVKPGDVHVDDTAKQDKAESTHVTDPTATPAAPAGNASKADWHAYALSIGIAEESLEDLSRDEIREAVNNVTAE